MRHIPARPEQTSLPNTLTQIVSEAPRAAALAPSLSAALDVAGAALNDIASLARDDCNPPQSRAADESIELARRVADETIRVFDRISCILEAIERLTCDSDDAVSDLASIGLSLVAEQCERVDATFAHLAHRASTEVCHG